MMGRYVILTVEYEPDATHAQRSLGWLPPVLVDAGLTMTEDSPRLRKWAGVIDGETYARFADAWGVRDESRIYIFDGMEFESDGFSPVVYWSLSVSEPVEADRQIPYAAAYE